MKVKAIFALFIIWAESQQEALVWCYYLWKILVNSYFRQIMTTFKHLLPERLFKGNFKTEVFVCQ